jgi:hypothetical protein
MWQPSVIFAHSGSIRSCQRAVLARSALPCSMNT